MKELVRRESEVARRIPAGVEAVLPSDQRALAAIIINMLHRHSHGERRAILRFALEKEGEIPVSRASIFSGTHLDPGRIEE
jgi:hypothetical protein